MIKKQSPPRRYYPVSSYLFTLTVIFGIMMLITGIALFVMISPTIKGMTLYNLLYSGWFASIMLLVFVYLAWIVLYYAHAFEYFGIVCIKKDCIVVRAPLHKSIRIGYNEIHDLGIDYGRLSVEKQFWIFLSKDKLSSKYLHRITKLPLSQKCIRIQYSKHVYNALLYYLPTALKKELSRCSSVIRLHNLNETDL